MSDKLSTTEKLVVRRRFLASAVVGGAGVLCAMDTVAGANNLNGLEACGELTAADPLYLYAQLVPQLQPAAIIAGRRIETEARESLSVKLEELWTLADELKLKLSRLSKIQPTMDRMSTLAYIGHTNARAVNVTLKSKSAEMMKVNMTTQDVITKEIIKTALALSQEAEKTLKADEWSLLQKLLAMINDIKTIQQPAAIAAGEEFDKLMRNVNASILAIQTALINASRNVVLGEKAQAEKEIKSALAELQKLPSDFQTSNESRDAVTRDQFVRMVEPILALLTTGTKNVPQISHHRRAHVDPIPLAFVSHLEIVLPNAVVDSSSVRTIVRQFFVSGNWWQVIGITAACLPLWTAYSQSGQRMSLIKSAISAVPRGRGTNLEAAADALNRLLS